MGMGWTRPRYSKQATRSFSSLMLHLQFLGTIGNLKECCDWTNLRRIGDPALLEVGWDDNWFFANPYQLHMHVEVWHAFCTSILVLYPYFGVDFMVSQTHEAMRIRRVFWCWINRKWDAVEQSGVPLILLFVEHGGEYEDYAAERSDSL